MAIWRTVLVSLALLSLVVFAEEENDPDPDDKDLEELEDDADLKDLEDDEPADATASKESTEKVKGHVIGIDLGTTFSCVAIMKDTGVEVIPNDQGNRITPSYVSFTESGRLLGDAAKNAAADKPSQTIYDIKRLIGRRFEDATVQEDMKTLPYKVLEDDEKLKVRVTAMGEKKSMTPEEISAMVLTKMKETAETFLGEEVKNAVITVPAYFNNAQREATKDAGTIAGLNVLRIINEPTAAAIAYGLDKKDESNILVYDLGGGTFDVSLLTVANGVIEVLATNGDTHLGGEDFDLRVVEHLQKVFEERHKKQITLPKDKKAMHKLKQAAEKAKIALSSGKETKVEIDGLLDGIDFVETLTRAKFEELNKDLFKKTLDPLKRVLEDGKLQKNEVHEIVTVGGSTRIPKIQDMLKSFFSGKELNRKLNPDEAVAYGAAVQGGVLKGVAPDDLVLLDIASISLGMETNGGIFDKIVPRNTALPVKKSRTYVTSDPDSSETNIRVFEGERSMTADNNELGSFKLEGFPRGKPISHEVNFEVDANGILKVSAKITDDSVKGGKENSITITKDNQRLSAQQIQDMIKDAEKYAKEDSKKLTEAERKVRITKYTKDTKYKMNKIRAKMTDAEKTTVDAKLSDAEGLENYQAPEGVQAKIVDPDSKKPSDWDDEEDGDWEPAMIDNPELKDTDKLLEEIQGVIDPILSKYPEDGSEVKDTEDKGEAPAPDDKGEEDEDDDLSDLEEDDDSEKEEL